MDKLFDFVPSAVLLYIVKPTDKDPPYGPSDMGGVFGVISAHGMLTIAGDNSGLGAYYQNELVTFRETVSWYSAHGPYGQFNSNLTGFGTYAYIAIG